MKIKMMLAAILSAVLAAPCLASKPKSIPTVGGGQGVALDKYVAEFKAAMEKANGDMEAMQTAIMAIQVPSMTTSGAIAAQVATAAEYAAITGIMLRAEAAHAKFLKHVLNYQNSDDLDIKLRLKSPKFDGNKNDAHVKAHKDILLKGRLKSPSGARAVNTSEASGRKGTGSQNIHSVGAGGGGQQFAAVSSPFSYAAAGGSVGTGFQSSLTTADSAHQSAITLASAGSVDGAGINTSGLAGAGGGGSSAGTVGARTPVNPAASQISINNSDVASRAAQAAMDRMNARQSAAESQGQKQNMGDLAKQAMQGAQQAMKKTEKNEKGCKNCNQQKSNEGKEKQAEAEAAMAP